MRWITGLGRRAVFCMPRESAVGEAWMGFDEVGRVCWFDGVLYCCSYSIRIGLCEICKNSAGGGCRSVVGFGKVPLENNSEELV